MPFPVTIIRIHGSSLKQDFFTWEASKGNVLPYINFRKEDGHR